MEAATEVFYKNRSSKKLRKTHRKTPVPKSLFNKIAGKFNKIASLHLY